MGTLWADWKFFKKIIVLKCHLFSYCATTNHFLIRLWFVMKSGYYVTTGSIKPNLHQKQIMVPVWWASLIHNSFLNPRETFTSKKYAQQIDVMHWKLQYLQSALVNRKGQILQQDSAQPHVVQPTFQKLNELGYKFCLMGYIHLTCHQLTTTSSGISTTFCRENVQQEVENAIQEFIEPRSMDFLCYRNKGKTMCWL